MTVTTNRTNRKRRVKTQRAANAPIHSTPSRCKRHHLRPGRMGIMNEYRRTCRRRVNRSLNLMGTGETAAGHTTARLKATSVGITLLHPPSPPPSHRISTTIEHKTRSRRSSSIRPLFWSLFIVSCFSSIPKYPLRPPISTGFPSSLSRTKPSSGQFRAATTGK